MNLEKIKVGDTITVRELGNPVWYKEVITNLTVRHDPNSGEPFPIIKAGGREFDATTGYALNSAHFISEQ